MLLANRLKLLREEKNFLQRQLAAALEIDTPMYSKIERGYRIAKRDQVVAIAKILSVNENELLTLWLADKIIYIADNEVDIIENALKIVRENTKK